jgi:hypothetical protein
MWGLVRLFGDVPFKLTVADTPLDHLILLYSFPSLARHPGHWIDNDDHDERW